MQIMTKFHGSIEVANADIIDLVQPILGFPDPHRYVLLPHAPDSPFLYLQSVDLGSLCFIAVDPLLFMTNYALPEEEIRGIGGIDEWAVLCLCTITVPGPVTINLRSPVIINKNTRQGGQFVLSVPYPYRYPILQEAAHASLNT